MHKYQEKLLKSDSAKLLAVRKVTQDNRGRKTAGVDGVILLKPEDRLKLAKEIKLDGTPIRRVYIPKPGTDEKRPLGIPTVRDRAKQALAKMGAGMGGANPIVTASDQTGKKLSRRYRSNSSYVKRVENREICARCRYK